MEVAEVRQVPFNRAVGDDETVAVFLKGPFFFFFYSKSAETHLF